MIFIGLRNHRIQAITPKDIYIPRDLTNLSNCIIQNQLDDTYLDTDGDNPHWNKLPFLNGSFSSLRNRNKTVMISGLCGKSIRPIEVLACTVSHLTAIHSAIYYNDSNPYAIIAEDDNRFAFDINIEQLINSAPKDFTILQLFTSSIKLIPSLWNRYIQNNSDLWLDRSDNSINSDFRSAGAYIINKARLKPIINSIIKLLPDGRKEMKIIAARKKYSNHKFTCIPKECCNNQHNFLNKNTPCVNSPLGYIADIYIYALGKTYVLTVPIMTGGSQATNSTLYKTNQYNLGLKSGSVILR